jgi:hypothetical protein
MAAARDDPWWHRASPGSFALAEGALIQALQQRGQSLVEMGEREELFVLQYGNQPAFCQENGGLDFSFIPWLEGARRHDGHVTMLRQFQVGAIQFGIIAAGTRNPSTRIVRHH